MYESFKFIVVVKKKIKEKELKIKGKILLYSVSVI